MNKLSHTCGTVGQLREITKAILGPLNAAALDSSKFFRVPYKYQG